MATDMKVYNNLRRKKVPFETLEPGKVRFYSCGPTTYDFLHVGNARALVVGDLMHRVFKALDYDVNYVRNFTDVDDKIIARANERGVDALEHSAQYVEECKVDMEALNMLPANHTPKVSETMDEIIEMIATLIEKDAAYEESGEVFYNVPSFKEYGKLSKKKLEDLEMGQRVAVDEKKHHPADFVLWKPAKEGEPSWESPWGKGRPGWHIECSAMSKKFLGETLDLHHGGVDLMFPHHENEIAQSEAANGKEFCNHWCHNEFLNFGSEKMSKSLGNVVTIRDFCAKYSGVVLRQILTSVHYRSKMEWSEEVIERAISDSERIHEFVKNVSNISAKGEGTELVDTIGELIGNVRLELANDFNVTGAMGRLFSFIRDLNREYFDGKKDISAKEIDSLNELLGYFKLSTGLVYDDYNTVLRSLNDAKKALNTSEGSISDEEVESLIAQRKEARTNKDWGKADEIRDRFKELGITVKDNPDGSTSWSY